MKLSLVLAVVLLLGSVSHAAKCRDLWPGPLFLYAPLPESASNISKKIVDDLALEHGLVYVETIKHYVVGLEGHVITWVYFDSKTKTHYVYNYGSDFVGFVLIDNRSLKRR